MAPGSWVGLPGLSDSGQRCPPSGGRRGHAHTPETPTAKASTQEAAGREAGGGGGPRPQPATLAPGRQEERLQDGPMPPTDGVCRPAGPRAPGAGGEAIGGVAALCSPLPFVLLGWLPLWGYPQHTSAQAPPQSCSAVGSTTQQGPLPAPPHSLLTAPIYAAPAGKAVPGPRRQLFLKDRYFRPGPARRGLFGGHFPFLANPVSCVYPAGPRRKPPRRPREGQSRRVPGCGEGPAWVPSGVCGQGWWARRGVGLWTR